MISNILEGATNNNGSFWFLLILIGAMVALFIFSGAKRKKEEKIAQEFASNLKAGDKVRTYSGIYGKIISIKDTVNGKVALIETGEGSHISYLTVDVFSILNIEVPSQQKETTKEVEEVVVVEDEKLTLPVEEKSEIAKMQKEEKKATKKKTTGK